MNTWVDMHNTEDKLAWCEIGLEKELEFVSFMNGKTQRTICINPEKEHNKYAPDLLSNGLIADLKMQETPFFTSGRYTYSPQHVVTFNEKDYLRYKEKYPDITIFFWVRWARTVYPDNPSISVDKMSVIWEVPFSVLADKIRRGVFPLHAYQRRVDDTNGNAKRSYVLNMKLFKPLLEIDVPQSEDDDGWAII